MLFETTISLGNLLTILSFFVVGVIFVVTTRKDVEAVKDNIDRMQKEIEKLNTVLGKMADQGGRIDRVEDRQLAQGRRLDDVLSRVNQIIDRGLSHD